MKLHIEIDSSNEALGYDNESKRDAIGGLLEQVKDKIVYHDSDEKRYLFDYNGNRVGWFYLDYEVE